MNYTYFDFFEKDNTEELAILLAEEEPVVEPCDQCGDISLQTCNCLTTRKEATKARKTNQK